ncbi:30S ribosomal protein S3 [Candidatus Peregrinibacteria bacterium]|jgi:small subunit ribosomal protein S3|nr:30S ribosomal protein S3 [Candidatus Peregrinibacteria bacterium]MBT3599075.1 30S ribosomal protein S3 [Candidatus Peregrinibacteria bacterium]MBT4367690.1 30S ribosomal protein S3 [Candidatus Peregrinibacteria bacterium]MBT4585624.1 30S ribosomal protein S3 [Candidatus Peregrinibacteria bacterium]MBT6730381.1 30S ribosomal protein S3 [Candidatus Peregrinibacteria bacterium]
MGQKVNPNGFRLGITHTWSSTWFAKGQKYKQMFLEDVSIRRYIREKLQDAGISKIDIERTKKTSVSIHTSKPGVVIGKQGAAIEQLKQDLEKKFGSSFDVNIQELRNPDGDAEVIAETIQAQMQRRMPFRRAARMAIEKAMQSGGVKGIKITISGRLNGADIARSEQFKEGNIPLQTLRANVEFAKRGAQTSYGTIGIKVWVYKGMIFRKVEHVQSASLHL